VSRAVLNPVGRIPVFIIRFYIVCKTFTIKKYAHHLKNLLDMPLNPAALPDFNSPIALLIESTEI